MLSPMTNAWTSSETLTGCMRRKGIGRRDFLTYCAEVSALLGLSSALTPRIARALENLKRPPVIWLQLQECTGCVETVLRTSNPSIGDLLLNTISLDFQHTIMAAAGDAAEAALHDAMRENRRDYVLVVTGSVPVKEDGIYTIMAGRTARTVLEEAASSAAVVLAVGACAHWGGVQAASPDPTGAVGVAEIIKNKPVVNIAGCPPIADVVTATVIHYLTFGRLPELDSE
ncbi:MAG: hydrogenase small subunit, partial [Gemmatimonadetes bacterium]|nr:hydrogenase small subunit [Gemmatimonadota bacterium]